MALSQVIKLERILSIERERPLPDFYIGDIIRLYYVSPRFTLFPQFALVFSPSTLPAQSTFVRSCLGYACGLLFFAPPPYYLTYVTTADAHIRLECFTAAVPSASESQVAFPFQGF